MRRTPLVLCSAALLSVALRAQAPGPEDLVKQGRALVSQGKLDEVIAEFAGGNLGDPFMSNLLGMAYEAKGDSSNARQYYRRTLELNAHTLQNAFARPHARAKLLAASQ